MAMALYHCLCRDNVAAFDNLCETFPDENCVLANREFLMEVRLKLLTYALVFALVLVHLDLCHVESLVQGKWPIILYIEGRIPMIPYNQHLATVGRKNCLFTGKGLREEQPSALSSLERGDREESST